MMMSFWVSLCLIFSLKMTAGAVIYVDKAAPITNITTQPETTKDATLSLSVVDAFSTSSQTLLSSTSTTGTTTNNGSNTVSTMIETTPAQLNTTTNTTIATDATTSTTTTITADFTKRKPCSAGTSILVTEEDAPVGTELLKIPAVDGETWELKDSGTPGQYLSLEQTNESIRLIFKQTPDIEEINTTQKRKSLREASTFYLHCFYRGWTYKYRQELIIHDVNEHAPVFNAFRSYNISISEASQVGARVFSLRHLAWDPDITGRIAGYTIRPYGTDPTRDGRGTFAISEKGSYILLLQPLDFDVMNAKGSVEFYLNITALDNGVPSPLTSHAILRIHVTDADDQGPVFWYPECPRVGNRCAVPYFQAIIKCGYKGPLQLYPGRLLAFDQDSINNTVSYSIEKVDPEWYSPFFGIGNQTGEISLETSSCPSSVQKVLVTVKATEDSLFHHSISTTLQVDILDNDNKMAFSNRRLQIPTLHETGLVGRAGSSSSGNSQHRKNEEHNVDKNGSGDDHGETSSSAENGENNKSKYTSLPAIFLILSLLGFMATGSGLAFAGIRLSRRKKTKTVDNCVGKESSDNTSECYGCGKNNSSDNASVVTSFAACPLNTPNSFINRAMHDSQQTQSRVITIGNQNSEQNESSSTSSDSFRGEHDSSEKEGSCWVQSTRDEENNIKEKIFQNLAPEKVTSQSEQNKQDQQQQWQQHQKQQQQQIQNQNQNKYPRSPSPPPPPPPPACQPEHSSAFPFSPNLFIQRRNLFQQQQPEFSRQQNGPHLQQPELPRQQNGQYPQQPELPRQQNGQYPQQPELPRQQNGQYPPPPPPPPPPPRPKESVSPEFRSEAPSVNTDSTIHHQQLTHHHHHHQQQQRQNQRHHLPSPHLRRAIENRDDSWKFLEDSENTEDFLTNRVSPSLTSSSSFTRGSTSTSADSMRHETAESLRIRVKKSNSFKEQLNQMVPQCFNLSNLGLLSSISATTGSNTNTNSSGNTDSTSTSFEHSPSSFPSDASSTSNHKVRFDVS